MDAAFCRAGVCVWISPVGGLYGPLSCECVSQHVPPPALRRLLGVRTPTSALAFLTPVATCWRIIRPPRFDPACLWHLLCAVRCASVSLVPAASLAVPSPAAASLIRFCVCVVNSVVRPVGTWLRLRAMTNPAFCCVLVSRLFCRHVVAVALHVKPSILVCACLCRRRHVVCGGAPCQILL